LFWANHIENLHSRIRSMSGTKHFEVQNLQEERQDSHLIKHTEDESKSFNLHDQYMKRNEEKKCDDHLRTWLPVSNKQDTSFQIHDLDPQCYLKEEEARVHMKARHEALNNMYGISSSPSISEGHKNQTAIALNESVQNQQQIMHAISPLSSSSFQSTTQKEIQVDKKKWQDRYTDVMAPADLPEGYVFEAFCEDGRFSATVPPGGVRKGQIFSTTICAIDKIEISAPVGAWRDELQNCCAFGLCHPLLLNAMFFPLIALGQIMSRVGLNWLGERGSKFESKNTCIAMSFIVIYWTAMNGLVFYGAFKKLMNGSRPSVTNWFFFVAINIIFMSYTIYIAIKTRMRIREMYFIPDGRCIAFEDFCCTLLCPVLTITQMGRHTADFSTFRSMCCTETGLPDHMNVRACLRNEVKRKTNHI